MHNILMMKNKIIKTISNPKIFVFTIIWLMVLVFFGTIEQKDIGLFESQKKYFTSLILWVYNIPLPGGLLTMSILSVNLFSFFLKPNSWRKNKIGILTVHAGALILLIGSAITNVFSIEGNMVIVEDEKSNYMHSFYYKEFTVLNLDEYKDSIEVINFNEQLLKEKEFLSYNKLPFKIEVIDFYLNSKLEKRVNDSLSPLRGDAINLELREKYPNTEMNKNISGITYKIISEDENINGYYIYQLEQRRPEIITINNMDYALLLRPVRTYLPFEIELLDFDKVMHPGTQIAKSFSSNVFLNENETSRRVLIEMNAPLRHKGYTLYQASYAELGDGREATVLAVVQNYGRLFPYISSIIMCIGVLLQMIIRIPGLLKND
ncbi:MAG: hypothetical protein CBE06_000260 [Pelagibacteraceae bacterium TMED246]|nr:MAG: hypothetical protein CBE06_000260 [Pelagibacteraceae bacterium TMED246]